MQWLNEIVERAMAQHPEGEIIVSSGVSPSGKYHLGTLREILTAEVIMLELKRRGRESRHLHIVDDLDIFRKVPAQVPEEWSLHLGKPLCDVPSPDGNGSYADYYLSDMIEAGKKLHLQMEVVRSHQKYREGFYVPAIEKALAHVDVIRRAITEVSGRQLEDAWSPIQVIEDGRLKNRQFKSIDTGSKTLVYVDGEGSDRELGYADGLVKLNWRIDWPGRWWLMGVHVEPFGRDHATKGGSYDTGEVIVRDVFEAPAPIPVPYDFINRTGETKKMSKSAGNTITASELVEMMPAEIVWYFILRAAPSKLLFFDEGETMMRLFDEFAALLAKTDRTADEQQLVELCTHDVTPTVSNIPFTHLVASYQASLKDADKTIDVIRRTEHAATAEKDAEIIRAELRFIDNWLANRAPEDVKFELLDTVNAADFNEVEVEFLTRLGEKVATAPADADGQWFHNAIYEFKESLGLSPKDMFTTLYLALIGRTSGPRAGWFLSILPRDWLTKRLSLK
ncbi:MAG TPA: lysine--tRNA ligase [Candidatus Saccharimonadales bacterium]|nr:lysine--tRNA ligase [Candidatus Saccharimonadales bacterium]